MDAINRVPTPGGFADFDFLFCFAIRTMKYRRIIQMKVSLPENVYKKFIKILQKVDERLTVKKVRRGGFREWLRRRKTLPFTFAQRYRGSKGRQHAAAPDMSLWLPEAPRRAAGGTIKRA
jgi:hypothetical protein